MTEPTNPTTVSECASCKALHRLHHSDLPWERTNPTPEAQGEWRERARYRGGVPLIDSLVNLLDDLEAKLAAANDLVRAMVEAQKTSEAHWRKEVEEVTARNEQLLRDGQHWLTVGRDNDELTERLAEVTAERDLERHMRNEMLKIVDDREAKLAEVTALYGTVGRDRDALKDQYHALAELYDSKTDALVEADEKLQSQEQELNEYKAERNEARRSNGIKDDQIANFNHHLQEQEAKLAAANDLVRDLTAETFRLGDWIEQLEGASIQ